MSQSTIGTITGIDFAEIEARLMSAGYGGTAAMIALEESFSITADITQATVTELESLQTLEPDTRVCLANREPGWYRQFANKKRYQR